MELIAISLARFVAFLELQSFDPRGQSTTREAIELFRNRYTFGKVPEKPEELDFQKGVEFIDGKMGSIVIDKLVLYTNGVAIDTRSSTDNSERVLQDILDEVKRVSRAVMLPTRRMYVSNLIFRSQMRFSSLHRVVQPLGDSISSALSECFGQPVSIDLGGIYISADSSQTKLTPSHFTIERRADTPFSANVYFSAAPLKTDLHIALIEKFESALGV
jgi:hypothetical protein